MKHLLGVIATSWPAHTDTCRCPFTRGAASLVMRPGYCWYLSVSMLVPAVFFFALTTLYGREFAGTREQPDGPRSGHASSGALLGSEKGVEFVPRRPFSQLPHVHGHGNASHGQ